VRVDDEPVVTGDEPLLLAAAAPTWIGGDRVAAARGLLASHPDVDVIVADDGLQHYALARDVEIVVIDETRDLGNRMLLPAGPLREPPSRLASVDAVVRLRPHGDANASRVPASTRPGEFDMTHEWQAWRNLANPDLAFDSDALHDPTTVAIAGIANPRRFFDALHARGFRGATRTFPDHHRYVRSDVVFPGARAVLMTEKDAVKCRAFGDARMWMQPIRARIEPALVDFVLEKIDGPEAPRNAGVPGDQGSAHL
jgi:tetraacyldisaccharide 4'-kinase